MKRYFREFIFYNRDQRLGILLLSLLFLLILGLQQGFTYYYSHFTQESEKEDSLATHVKQQEIQIFLSGISNRRQPRKHTYQPKTETVNYFPFNPNTADSATLRQLGLPAWMVRNILRYRAKGGKFRQPADFQKVYGLKKETYAALLPYINIPADTTRRSALLLERPTTGDSLKFAQVEKYPAGTIIELNGADTTELKKIPGIGSILAQKIVRYREQLGGFYDLKQLEEINLNAQMLTNWLTIDPQKITRIPINKASVARLNRHPYINFYQAKAFIDYRRKKGPIHHLKPFTLLEEFTSNDLKRMAYYLDFTE